MNTESYKEAFLEEAVENINSMNKALLAFEKNIADLTPINELFRSAHTLKGMSATMGYDRFAGFTHMLEEILDKIRSGTLAADLEIVNILFKATDIMQEFLDNIRDNNTDTAAGYNEIVERMKEHGADRQSAAKPVILQQSASAEASEVKMDFVIDGAVALEAAAQGLSVYRIKVEVAKTCAFKAVRAFMVSRNLSEKGEIVKSAPGAKDIEEGNFETSFMLGYVSKENADVVEKLISRISEIQKVTVEKFEAVKEEKQEPEDGKDGAEKQRQHEAGDGAIKKGVLSQSVRVNIEKLDAMMNLVGELVIAKIRLDRITKDGTYDSLSATVEEFDRIIDGLQMEVTDVRMLPVSQIFDRYPRIVRDLAAQAGKSIDVELIGGDIEIDRTVLEEINDSILHLVRNSVAHGIEDPEKRELSGKTKKGVIRLSARRDRNSVIIEVSDDGAGVNVGKVRKKALEKGVMTVDKINNMTDEEAVNLISLPGFSTADKVDKISGRGVGVDVVKTKVEAFGGIFRMENYPGEGMKSILKLPLTLAIIQALLVKSGGGTYAIPVIHTIETVEMPLRDVKVIQSRRVIILRNEVVPVLSLAELMGKACGEHEDVNMVIIEAHEKKIALEVEGVLGQQEIAIKSLGEFQKYAKGFSGVTILGDGSISLIVDVQALVENNMDQV
jgi:two-component system chemotaxis sensor kinase CheA